MRWPDDFVGDVVRGDCRKVLEDIPDGVIDLCVTSPPYWACRDYGEPDQLGFEPSPLAYVDELFRLFDVVMRKLARTGSLFTVIDDVWASNWTRCRNHTWVSSKSAFEGVSSEKIPESASVKRIGRNWPRKLGVPWIKAKQKLLLPARLQIKMQEEGGWYVRQDVIWHKTNVGNYTNVRDRFVHAYENVLHFTKSQKYYADMAAISHPESGKVGRDVLAIPIQKSETSHSAVFPEVLLEHIVKFACPSGGVVFDPFAGTGTTLRVAKRLGRKFAGVEISKDFWEIARSACVP